MDLALQHNQEDQSSNPQNLCKNRASMAASVIPMLGRQRQDCQGRLASYDWSNLCALGSVVRGPASVNTWRLIGNLVSASGFHMHTRECTYTRTVQNTPTDSRLLLPQRSQPTIDILVQMLFCCGVDLFIVDVK